MKPAGLLRFLGAVAFGLAFTGAAFAQGTVKVGAIYPLTGRDKSVGDHAQAAIEVAREIINNAHPEYPELGNLPLAKGVGLDGLGRAKIEVVWRDSKGEPDTGQNEAIRLINDEKVVALNGAYHSPVTQTASAAAERYGIPFLTGDSVADPLTQRGFKWFFRTTPVAVDFARLFADFLKDMKAKRQTIEKIAIVHEDNQYGISVASVVTKTFKANGLKITLNIPYSASSKSDYSSEVRQLKEGNPDVVIFMSYTDDAKRFAEAMMKSKYKPRIMIADDAGFSDPDFIKVVGPIAQGVLIRSSWSVGEPDTPSYRVNEMYKKKSGGVDLDNTSARIMQGFMVLADAINRAGSTERAQIQAKLVATDLARKQLIVRYNGVKFDEYGQNERGLVLLTQLQDTGKDGLKYVPVWPKEEASAVLRLPYKGW